MSASDVSRLQLDLRGGHSALLQRASEFQARARRGPEIGGEIGGDSGGEIGGETPGKTSGKTSPQTFREPSWQLESLLGRLVELSTWRSGGALTLACGLVLEAQQAGEPVVWVTARESSFFPPDFDAFGVDLDALAVLRLPRANALPRAADALARADAFGLIVLDLTSSALNSRTPNSRSLDSRSLGSSTLSACSALTPALEARLAAAAQKHQAAIVCLTEKPPSSRSLGPMVSLRVHAHVERAGAEHGSSCQVEAPSGCESGLFVSGLFVSGLFVSGLFVSELFVSGRFICEARAIKDKRHARGWISREVLLGPVGLR